MEVLEDYYAFLHSHNAEKSYKKHAGVDSGGGAAVLDFLCSAQPLSLTWTFSCTWLEGVSVLSRSVTTKVQWFSTSNSDPKSATNLD